MPTKTFKTREFKHSCMDSRIWNDFVFRNDDIIIVTYAKSGTTWMQQIVCQLIFQGQDKKVHDSSFWLEDIYYKKDEILKVLDSQQHRRFIKTHIPLDALVFSEKAKYLFVGRDGRDVAWSFHNHFMNIKEETKKDPNTKMLESPRDFFLQWMEKDGYPYQPFWAHIRSWWQARLEDNVMFIHFNNLKQNLPDEIVKIANFLGITIQKEYWGSILEHCSFDYMKKNGNACAPYGGDFLKGGGKTFFHQGKIARWKNVLSQEDIALYEKIAKQELGKECAHWLQTGESI